MMPAQVKELRQPARLCGAMIEPSRTRRGFRLFDAAPEELLPWSVGRYIVKLDRLG